MLVLSRSSHPTEAQVVQQLAVLLLAPPPVDKQSV